MLVNFLARSCTASNKCFHASGQACHEFPSFFQDRGKPTMIRCSGIANETITHHFHLYRSFRSFCNALQISSKSLKEKCTACVIFVSFLFVITCSYDCILIYKNAVNLRKVTKVLMVVCLSFKRFHFFIENATSWHKLENLTDKKLVVSR